MTPRALYRYFHRDADERGAILILSTVGVVLAMIFSAMAIDLGFTAQEARRNQKVADLAALDAVRDVTIAQGRAEASATRNDFASTAPNAVTAVRGTFSSGTFTPGVLGEDVQVTVTSPHTDLFPFVAGSDSVTRRAVASLQETASFSLGSKLAAVNTTDAGLYNQIFSALLGTTPAINLTAVGYQGLAGGTVSLADLVAADAGLGTPDALAVADSISVRRLAQASIVALNNKGDAASIAAATALGNFATTIPAALDVDMGDILSLSSPSDPAAVGAQMNVFDLITTSGQAAQIANGVNLISVPSLTVGIPNLTTSTLRLHLIEAPRIASGPARADLTSPTGWKTWAQTAQIGVDLTTSINIGSCTGFLATCIQLNLPITITAAKATGSLIDVDCDTPPAAYKHDTILVDTMAAEARAAASATIRLLGLTVPVPPILNAYQPLAGGTSSPPLAFSGPAYPTAIQSTAATGLGLATLLTGQLNLLGLNIGLGALLGQLTTVTNSIDNLILKPLFDSLGLSIGGADVRTLGVECGTPTLVQ